MKVHVLQHVPFENIGSIATWLDRHGADVSYSRLFESPKIPDPKGFDLIIIMGGPMSVNDEAKFPWISSEKIFIRDAVNMKTPVLGICLGAQIIASAFGARVYKNTEKEMGWFPVNAVSNSSGTFSLPESCTVFHWHGETFDLPPGALLLAKNGACLNQAFQIGRNVIGLQFHLEATPQTVRAILDNCGKELKKGRYIQSAAELKNVGTKSYAEINAIMDNMLSYLMSNSKK